MYVSVTSLHRDRKHTIVLMNSTNEIHSPSSSVKERRIFTVHDFVSRRTIQYNTETSFKPNTLHQNHDRARIDTRVMETTKRRFFSRIRKTYT